MGGCVAADVHGKNHHVAGCFGAHVSELTLAVAESLRAAATWLSGHQGRLPYRVKPKSTDGKVAVGLADTLRQYNTGTLLGGPPRGTLPRTIPSLSGVSREVLMLGILLCCALLLGGSLAHRRKHAPSAPR